MKRYAEPNISEKSQTTVKYFMKMLSSVSETIIFLFLGTSTVMDSHAGNAVFIVMTVVFCLLYRAIGQWWCYTFACSQCARSVC